MAKLFCIAIFAKMTTEIVGEEENIHKKSSDQTPSLSLKETKILLSVFCLQVFVVIDALERLVSRLMNHFTDHVDYFEKHFESLSLSFLLEVLFCICCIIYLSSHLFSE